MFKNILKLVAVLAVSLSAQTARAEDPSPSWSVDTSVGVYSDYMWRGFNLYDGMSVQPSVTANYDTGAGIISASLWAHLSADQDTEVDRFFEMDETISYSYNFNKVTLKIGNAWYTYPRDSDGIDNTAEVFAALALDDSGFLPFTLSPSLSVYHDYDEYDNQYYELGLSHAFALQDGDDAPTLTPFVAFGFASNADKAYTDDGLVQVTSGVYLGLSVGSVSVTPSLNYTCESDDNAVDEFWMGTALSYSF